MRSFRWVLVMRPNESHPQPKTPAEPVERLDRRVALARFDALERQRAQPAMVCELFLRQAAALAHAFDGLPAVQAAGIEVGVELVAQRTRVFEVTAPAWLGRHGRSERTGVGWGMSVSVRVFFG